MQRSHVAADVLTQIQACFTAAIGTRCQEFVFARTRGIPPADCNSVTVSWVDRGQGKPFGDCAAGVPCDGWDAVVGMRIVLTEICMGPDQSPSFDWPLEDAASACFDDDLDILENCINCTDWSQFMRDHFLDEFRYEGTTYDVETEGGGFSAYIEMTLVARECCPTVP